MPTAVLVVYTDRIDAGLITEKFARVSVKLAGVWPENGETLHQLAKRRTQLHLAFEQLFSKLLVSATKTHVIVTLPVLVQRAFTKALAKVLLEEFRALSLSTIPYSVACTIAAGSKSAIIWTKQQNELLAIPVSHLCELTPLIRTTKWTPGHISCDCDDLSPTELTAQLIKSLPIDSKRLVSSTTVLDFELSETHEFSGDIWPMHDPWVGAVVAAQNGAVKYGVSRNQYLNEGKDLTDPLFDVW